MQLNPTLIDRFTRSAVGKLNVGSLDAKDSQIIMDFRTRLANALLVYAQQNEDVKDYVYERLSEAITEQIIYTSSAHPDEKDIPYEDVTMNKQIQGYVQQSLDNIYGSNVKSTAYHDVMHQMKDLANPIHPRFSMEKTINSMYKANRSYAALTGQNGVGLLDPKYEDSFNRLTKNEKAYVLYNLAKNETNEMSKWQNTVKKNTNFLNEIRKQYNLTELDLPLNEVPEKVSVFGQYGIDGIEQTKGRFGVKEARAKVLDTDFMIYRQKIEHENPLPARPTKVDKVIDKADDTKEKIAEVSDKAKSKVLQNDLQKPVTKERVNRQPEKVGVLDKALQNPDVRAFLKRHRVPIVAATALGVVGLHAATGGMSSYVVGVYGGAMISKYNVVEHVKEAMVRKMIDAKHGVKQGFYAMKEDIEHVTAPVKNVVRAGYNRLSAFARQFKDAFSENDNEKLREYDEDAVMTEAIGETSKVASRPNISDSIFGRKFKKVPKITTDRLYDELQKMNERVAQLETNHLIAQKENEMLRESLAVMTQTYANNQVLNDKLDNLSSQMSDFMNQSLSQTREKLINRENEQSDSIQNVGRENDEFVKAYEEASHISSENTFKEEPINDDSLIDDYDDIVVDEDQMEEEEQLVNLKQLLRDDFKNPLSDDEFTSQFLRTVPKEQRSELAKHVAENGDVRDYATQIYLRDKELQGEQVYEEPQQTKEKDCMKT